MLIHARLCSRTTTARVRRPRVRWWSLLLLVPVVGVVLAVGAGPSAARRPKPKIIVVSPPKGYVLTVDGRFKVVKGDATEDGTLSAPKIKVTFLSSKGTGAIMFGTGNARVPNHLFIATNCELRGTISFDLTVGPAGVNGADTSELPPLSPKISVPDGKVALSVNGAAVGLVAMMTKGETATAYELGGVQRRNCKIGDPPQDFPAVLAATAANETLFAANMPPLVFPSGGGTVERSSRPGENPDYFYSFLLKRA